MPSTNIQVSPEVKTMLPSVLIDYLCKIALSNENKKESVQTFELVPSKLSGQSIQNILHLDKLIKVFGFTPVRCKLSVLSSPNQYQMILNS
jgi:hypothetical protein